LNAFEADDLSLDGVLGDGPSAEGDLDLAGNPEVDEEALLVRLEYRLGALDGEHAELEIHRRDHVPQAVVDLALVDLPGGLQRPGAAVVAGLLGQVPLDARLVLLFHVR